MEEELEGLEEPEDHSTCCKTASSRHDGKDAPTKSQQYGHLNKTRIMGIINWHTIMIRGHQSPKSTLFKKKKKVTSKHQWLLSEEVSVFFPPRDDPPDRLSSAKWLALSTGTYERD